MFEIDFLYMTTAQEVCFTEVPVEALTSATYSVSKRL
jgi:hypothetical protein